MRTNLHRKGRIIIKQCMVIKTLSNHPVWPPSHLKLRPGETCRVHCMPLFYSRALCRDLRLTNKQRPSVLLNWGCSETTLVNPLSFFWGPLSENIQSFVQKRSGEKSEGFLSRWVSARSTLHTALLQCINDTQCRKEDKAHSFLDRREN